MMILRVSVTIFMIALLLSIENGCGEPKSESTRLSEALKSVDSVQVDIYNPALDELKTELVMLSDSSQVRIQSRFADLKQFPCSDCHTKPLAQLSSNTARRAHWNIALAHASKSVMDCATCHGDPQTDHLMLLRGGQLKFNMSHEQCAQCHSTQFKDWVGGAHGKQVGGWAPPKIKLTCVSCHDPHKPGFPQRWPARYNTSKSKTKDH